MWGQRLGPDASCLAIDRKARIAGSAEFGHTRVRCTSRMFMYVYIHLSIYPSTDLSVRLSIYPSIRLSVYPSIRLSVYPSVYLSIYLSIYLAPSLSLSLYVCMYVCVYIYIYIYIHADIHTSIHLYIRPRSRTSDDQGGVKNLEAPGAVRTCWLSRNILAWS